MNWILSKIADFVALLLYIFIEPARWLTKSEYKGWEGALLRAPLGFLFGAGAGVAAAHHVGWDLNYNWLAWIGAGALTWAFGFFYVWPAATKFLLRPAFRLVDKIWDAYAALAKKYAEPVFGGIVNALGKLPGSGQAWSKVLEKKDGWFNNGVTGLFGFAVAAGAGWLGWQVWGAVETMFSAIPMFDWVIGLTAGVIVFAVIGGFFWKLIEHGKLQFIASALAVGLSIIFQAELLGLAALAGLSGAVAYAVFPLLFVAFVAYVYPLVSWALGGDFIKWLVKEKIVPFSKTAYNDEDKDYRLFYRHVLNLAATGGITYGAFVLGGMVAGLPVWGVWAFAALAGISAYFIAYDWLDNSGDSGFVGFLASAGTAYLAYSQYVAAALPGGIYIGIVAGALAAIVTGFLAYPAVYRIFKGITKATYLYKLGGALDWVHKTGESAGRWVGDKLSVAYDSSYRDRSGYQEWFLHAANIYVAYAVVKGVMWFGWSLPVTIPVAALAAFVSYSAVGRFLQKTSVGVSFIGFLVALAAGLDVGTRVDVALSTPYHWLAIVVGLFAGFLTAGLFFPTVYLIAKAVLNPLVASWSKGFLAKAHEAVWSVFQVFADMVANRLSWLIDIMKPVWARIAATFAAIAARVAAIRDRLTGGKKKA